MQRAMPFLLVGLGGVLGANARYAASRLIGTAAGGFPWATFAINVSGSFLLGLLGALLARHAPAQAEALRLALGVGFLGAYTTFSTFEYETQALLEQRAWLVASANVVLSVALGLMALRLGAALARVLG